VDSTKNLRVVAPGDNYVLLDGTEANSLLASVAIVRGPSASQSQAYSTFHAVGLGAAETCDVQASNTDVDGDYYTIATMTSELASPAGIPNFTDSGSPLFYRVKKSGGACAVKVQR
jgi:hypothetical protein